MNIPVRVFDGCLKGDRRAQERLYRLSFDALMSVSCRYKRNRDDALHMVNQGFYKILSKLHQYDRERSYLGWIRRIMTNMLIDDYRKVKSGIEITKEISDVSELEIPHDRNLFEADIEAEALNQMLLALPEIRNRIFNLYAIDGYSHLEISEILGIPEGTSKWHLSKAREELRGLILNKQGQKKGIDID